MGSALLPASTSPVLAQLPHTQSGTWNTKAPAPSKRTEVAAALLEGKIYVVGGFSELSLSNIAHLKVSNAVEVYDPVSDTWSTTTPLPARLHHTGAMSVGKRLYVIGGFSASVFSVWKPVDTVFIYDPSTKSWSEGAPLPTPRGALAVTEIEGKLYAVGGYAEDGNTGALEVYDPATNSWSTKAPLPTPRDHLAAAAVEGKLYAIGGRIDIDYGRNLAVTESYDPATDRWTQVAPLPTARSGIAAAVIQDQIYVVGGEAPEGTFTTNEVYLPVLDRWRLMEPMPTGRHGLGAAAVNNRLYAISGGPKPGGSYSHVNEQFDPSPARSKQRTGKRASAKHVGTIMALLAVFQDAGVLPPETSPEANRLIKALIQFQAAFMKTNRGPVRQLLSDALQEKFGVGAPEEIARFRNDGWTSQSLEAVVDFSAGKAVWNRSELPEGFKAFNIGATDFDLLSRIFTDARAHFATAGGNIHTAFAERRREMPGGNM